MKYRIIKETYAVNGKEYCRYIPERKVLFFWNSMEDYAGTIVSFDTLKQAEQFIKDEIYSSKSEIVKEINSMES